MNAPGDNIRNYWAIQLPKGPNNDNMFDINVSTFNHSGFDPCNDYVYVNSIKASSGTITNLKDDVILITTNPDVPFEYGISIDIIVKDSNATAISHLSRSFTYIPDLSEIEHSEYRRCEQMTKNSVSYGILRVNPKLTGNIKVVVDPDYNIYLDTFKISSALASSRYRKCKVDYKDYYGKNVMDVFSGIASSELFAIDKNCYNIFTAPDTFDKQYYDTYNYGVRTNSDKLYKQNFSYLAPLRIKEKLPDMFIIMKVPSSNGTSFTTEHDKIDYFMRNGEVVKSFDMRQDTILGTYLRNIQSHASKKTGDIYVAYDHRNMDMYNGISIDRGVVSTAYESPFSADAADNQVAMNDYRTLGFERNRLVSKDIINLEYMFDDENAEQFEICTYFGLYVTLNNDSSSFSILGDGTLSNEISEIPEAYTDFGSILYGVTVKNDFIRLGKSVQKDLSDISTSTLYQYANMPDNVACNASIRQIAIENDSAFMTVRFDKELKPGDHVRIIKRTAHDIYEVIISNMTDGTVDGLSDICLNHYMSRKNDAYDIQRIQIYLDDDSDMASQIDLVEKAFKKFGFTVTRISDDEIGLISDDTDSVFEKICSVSGFEPDQESQLLTTGEDDDPITAFGFFNPRKSYLDVNDSLWERLDIACLFPMHFELVGNRTAYTARFIPLYAGSVIYCIGDADISLLNKHYLLYKDTLAGTFWPTSAINLKNEQITKIASTEYVTEAYALRYIDGTSIMAISNPVMTRSITAFINPMTLTQCICSIHPIKDYDYDVYDSKSSLTFTASSNIVGTSGEFTASEFDGSVARVTDEETICNYIDKYDSSLTTYIDASYMVARNGINSVNRHAYYKALADNNVNASSISLTAPSTCKWAAIGTDHRCRPMRLMYDLAASQLPSKSYYIPCEDTSIYTGITNNLGLLSLYEKKGGGFDYKKYVQNSPGTIVTGEYVRSLENDILYGNSSISNILQDSSSSACQSVIYSCGSNGIGFISGGLKFIIKSSNDQIMDLSQYVGYSAVFMTVPGYCPTHNCAVELLIDELHKEACLIWYSCQDTLDVSDSYTSKFMMAPVHGRVQDHDIYGSYAEIDFTHMSDYAISYLNNQAYVPNGSSLIYNFMSRLNNYAKIYDVTLTGSIDSSAATSEYVKKENMYMYAGNACLGKATNDDILRYTNDIYSSAGAYLVRKDGNDLSPYKKILSNLKTDLSSLAILIRTYDGAKDYTTVKNLLTVSIDSPYMVDGTYPVVPAFMEPVMKDMLSFSHDVSACISDAFEMTTANGNMSISDVSKLSQVWINKITPESNFCSCGDNHKISIDVIHGVSIMDNAWIPGKYRKYFKEPNIVDERYESHTGYTSGMEPNCYLNSRGVSMKNSSYDDIVIDSWKNTKVYQKNGYIKFAITDSLMHKIRFTTAYIRNWTGTGAADTYKIKYIRNTIFNYITVTGRNAFELYFEDGVTGFNVKDMSGMTSSAVKVDNVKHELKYENGRYYMYVYPENTGTYFAKFTIKL